MGLASINIDSVVKINQSANLVNKFKELNFFIMGRL